MNHQTQSSTAAISRREDLSAIVGIEPTSMEITIEESKQPQFQKSIDDLVTFSAAVEAFKRQYDDLQKHMDYIGKAIESKLKPPSPLISNDASGETTAIVASTKAEAQRLCEIMCSKGLRRYVIANISDRAKLIEEIPVALKSAKEPAKFVLECVGKFYIQGRKAFAVNSPMYSARKVSLLIMECFLLMPHEEEKKLEVSVKEEAEAAAVTWKKRLVNEGGLAAAQKLDARGLLLLIACFGIPSSFRYTDLMDLLKQSGCSEILGALRRSPYLVPMISVIVESSIKRGMHLEALELVYTFGMEDKFAASSILTAFLRFSKESFERAKRKGNSPVAFKEATEKQLAALASVLRFLETHNLDPVKEVPGWEIKELMVQLKKDNLQLDKQMEEKARSISLMEEALLTERLYNQQMKRPRLSPMEMPPVASSSYSPIYRDRSFLSHRDGDRDDISALVSSYLGPSSSFPRRSSLRRTPEYMAASGGLGRTVSAYEHLPPNMYSPVPRRCSPVHGQRNVSAYEHLPPNLYSPVPRQCSPVHRQRLPQQYSPSINGEQQIPFTQHRAYRHSSSEERYLGLLNHRSHHRHSSTDHNENV